MNLYDFLFSITDMPPDARWKKYDIEFLYMDENDDRHYYDVEGMIWKFNSGSDRTLRVDLKKQE